MLRMSAARHTDHMLDGNAEPRQLHDSVVQRWGWDIVSGALPPGSRIVAETFVGLLRGDPDSILCQYPWWRWDDPMPWLDLPSADPTTFTMADLIAFGAGGREKETLSLVDDRAKRRPPPA